METFLMIRSMTTFARSSVNGTGWSIAMELKSVNGRYCDVHARIPRSLAPIEDRIKKTIQQRLQRGRVDFFMQVEGSGSAPVRFNPDVTAGRAWLTAAEKLAQELRLSSRPTMSDLLASVPNIITMSQAPADETEQWKQLEGPLSELLDMAEEMALREGADLEADIRERLEAIRKLLEKIIARRAEHLEAAQQALKERVQKLLDLAGMDETRLAQEAAIMADRLDITEETVRAGSHIDRFFEYLTSQDPVGRRLDFLTQELFREFNTMASKSCDSAVSQAVVEVKGELEKIREQVQNVV